MPNGDGSLPLCGLNGVIQRLSAVHENRFKKTRKSETESADRSGALDYFFREFDTGGTKIRRFKTLGTTYGKLGVKVWICNGEILPTRNGPKREIEDVTRDGKRKPRRRDDNGRRGDNRGRGNNDRRQTERKPRQKREERN